MFGLVLNVKQVEKVNYRLQVKNPGVRHTGVSECGGRINRLKREFGWGRLINKIVRVGKWNGMDGCRGIHSAFL